MPSVCQKNGWRTLEQGDRRESEYVFTSQRAKKTLANGERDGWRWMEDGIHVSGGMCYTIWR